MCFGFIHICRSLTTHVVICVLGDSLRWVERFSAASDMQIYRRIVVLHHTPYGFMEIGGDRVEVTSMSNLSKTITLFVVIIIKIYLFLCCMCVV